MAAFFSHYTDNKKMANIPLKWTAFSSGWILLAFDLTSTGLRKQSTFQVSLYHHSKESKILNATAKP